MKLFITIVKGVFKVMENVSLLPNETLEPHQKDILLFENLKYKNVWKDDRCYVQFFPNIKNLLSCKIIILKSETSIFKSLEFASIYKCKVSITHNNLYIGGYKRKIDIRYLPFT